MANEQYVQGQSQFFGQDPGPLASTGAPGTPGASPESSAGPVVGRVVVTSNYASSQTPQPEVAVLAGDTSAFSSDNPNVVWATGEDQVSAAWTAGAGHIGAVGNPNAQTTPSMSSQTQAARRSS